jgi:molybdopterin synthase sulfur carrier subunit
MIRVVLPAHLRTLANTGGEVILEISGTVTQRSILDALEARYPMLCGTIRDHVTKRRRPFVRFFACEEDLSHESPDAPLPEPIATGAEPFLVVGAIAGGSCRRPDVLSRRDQLYLFGKEVEHGSERWLRDADVAAAGHFDIHDRRA